MKIFLLFPAALAFVVLSGCATCEPRPNLGLYKQQLVAWHDSGAYAKCFASAVAPAAEVLRREAARPSGRRWAVVLDIDETSLSNWGYLTAHGFDLSVDSFKAWMDRHDDPALPPTLTLFRAARAAGITVFFVSGRKEFMRAATERQLRAAGYEGWSGLFLVPPDYTADSIVPFKQGARRAVTEKGWTILLNLGDQWSDLEGGYALHPIKLPNPYYFIR